MGARKGRRMRTEGQNGLAAKQSESGEREKAEQNDGRKEGTKQQRIPGRREEGPRANKKRLSEVPG